TVVTGINDLGQIIGYFNDATGPHGFIESGGTFAVLTSQYVPSGIDDAGDLVGTYYDSATGAYRGFLATVAPTSPLDPQPIGTEFLVNTHTLDVQTGQAIAPLSNGGFVFTWQSFAQDGSLSYGVYGQMYDASGNAVGGEF